MVEDKGYFCNRPLKPWILLLVFLTASLITWLIIQKEAIVLRGEFEDTQAERNISQPQGEPVFPDPIKLAALSSPHSLKHYGIDAITKATPKGGIQLVANPSHMQFQNALRDAANSIIPSVCDIHAMWINR
jgi:hypothetical protein